MNKQTNNPIKQTFLQGIQGGCFFKKSPLGRRRQVSVVFLLFLFGMVFQASGGPPGGLSEGQRAFLKNRPLETRKTFNNPTGEKTEEVRLVGVPFVYRDWEMFYVKDGLPNDHIFTLEADGDRLWVGTENGLALYENGKWKSWQMKDGLPWKVVSDIAISKKTGEIWLALFGGGLSRFSGGRFDHFNQFNSGLVNDVVYGVTILDDTVWAATTAGVSSYNTVNGEWEIYTEKNAPMEEIWCYNIDSGDGKVYVAVWGGGILEWDTKTRRWNAHRDPDKEMEIDLYRDDGLIHIITTSASYVDRVLWASTYFGLSRYDGRHWRGYMDHDSGLPSSFINFALGRSGTSCYNATDKGLGVLVDFETDAWVTYERKKETDKTWTASIGVGNKKFKTVSTNLSLPNHFIISVEFQGNDLWIGTGHGLARGIGKNYYPGLKRKETKRSKEEKKKTANQATVSQNSHAIANKRFAGIQGAVFSKEPLGRRRQVK